MQPAGQQWPLHYVLDAALVGTNRWIGPGVPPPRAPQLDVSNGRIVRDLHGNAIGGIRTPQVDAPVVALSGEGQSGTGFCFLLGTTEPFDNTTLASLYPDRQADIKAFDKATDAALKAGFILTLDASDLTTAARARAAIEPQP